MFKQDWAPREDNQMIGTILDVINGGSIWLLVVNTDRRILDQVVEPRYMADIVEGEGLSGPYDLVGRNPIRLTVPPGLTGLWQISGRKDTGCAFMISKDLEYICKRSLAYDLGIIIQTVLVVVRRSGAR